MRQAKELITGHSHRVTVQALSLTQNQLRIATRALTGHCRLRRHMFNLGLADTAVCRFCSKDEKTPIHVLCECGALAHKRNQLLGGHLLTPDKIRSISPKRIAQFFIDVGLEDEM